MISERAPTGTLSGKQPNRVITFTLGCPTPSCNEWHGKHWGAYHRIRKAWGERVGMVVRTPMCGLSCARIDVMRLARRKLDAANAEAGLKPIIDALVYFGVIKNDTLRYLPEAPKVTQVKVSSLREEGCIIKIYEICTKL